MKKEGKLKKGKVLAIIFIASVLLILSVNIVSASLLGDIGNWFNNLFGEKEKSINNRGELATIGVSSVGSNDIIIYASNQTSSEYGNNEADRRCDSPFKNASYFYLYYSSGWGYYYSGSSYFNMNSFSSNSVNNAEVCYAHSNSGAFSSYPVFVLNESSLICPAPITTSRFTTDKISYKEITDTGYGFRYYCFDITNYVNSLLSKGQKNLYITLATNSEGNSFTFYGLGIGYDPYLNLTPSGPSIRVISPNGGETLKLGETKTISWQVSDNTSPLTPTYRIYLTREGYQDNYLGILVNGETSFNWNVSLPSGWPKENLYKIKITGHNAFLAQDTSDNNFIIVSSQCSSECSSGQKRCNGNYVQTCADYNSDGCYEWGGDTNCPNGCSNNQCNSCTPATCSSLGKQCGSWSDNCGNTLNCGTCPSGQSCNANGQCTIIVCNQKSDCGIDGWTGNAFCQNGNVYQNYIIFTCNNPGTSSSYCSNSTNAQLKQTCNSIQTCLSGQCVSNSCTNNCTSSGLKRCNGNNLQTCGDYNNDTCLEWGGDFPCTSGCNSTTNLCNGCTLSCVGKICGQSDSCGSVCNLPCNDDNKCTIDSCSVTGCLYTPVNCPAGQHCDNATGFCSLLCDGCLLNGTCINRGIRTTQNNISIFCGINNIISDQKNDNSTCSNNYECLSNECSDGICVGLIKEVRQQTGLLWQIWCWITNLFNSAGYSQCIALHSS